MDVYSLHTIYLHRSFVPFHCTRSECNGQKFFFIMVWFATITFVSDDDDDRSFLFVLFLYIFQVLCVIVLSIVCPLLFTSSFVLWFRLFFFHSSRILLRLSSFLRLVRVCFVCCLRWFFVDVVIIIHFTFCVYYFSGSKPVLCSVHFPCCTESIYLRSLSMRFYAARAPSLALLVSVPSCFCIVHRLPWILHCDLQQRRPWPHGQNNAKLSQNSGAF